MLASLFCCGCRAIGGLAQPDLTITYLLIAIDLWVGQQARADGAKVVQLRIDGMVFAVMLDSMTQINRSTGGSRKVRRTPQAGISCWLLCFVTVCSCIATSTLANY